MIFTRGATDAIGLLFAVVGVASFVLRPFEAASWALLSMSAFAGGALLTAFIPIDSIGRFSTIYILIVVSVVPFAALHASLAFPIVHASLRRRSTVLLTYGLSVMMVAINVAAAATDYAGPLTYARTVGLGAILVAIVVLIARCFVLALRATDPVVAQRSRILLGGTVIGLAPFAVFQFVREAFGVLPIDSRFTIWPIGAFVLAIGRITVRQELLNARIAVRRAVLYTGAVAVLTVIALLLIAVRPYAVAVLLFPLLYLWPRFEARLNRRLYPQRARFPELLRTIGTEMAECDLVDAVLDVLTQAPAAALRRPRQRRVPASPATADRRTRAQRRSRSAAGRGVAGRRAARPARARPRARRSRATRSPSSRSTPTSRPSVRPASSVSAPSCSCRSSTSNASSAVSPSARAPAATRTKAPRSTRSPRSPSRRCRRSMRVDGNRTAARARARVRRSRSASSRRRSSIR